MGSRCFLGFVAIVLALALASAPAVATHNTPYVAKRTAVTFVTSYLPCAGGSLHDPVSGRTDACPAQRRNSNVSFDGEGYLSGFLKYVPPGAQVLPTSYVAPGTVGPDARVQYGGRGVKLNGVPFSGDLFLLNRPRTTLDACGSVPCTLTDQDGAYPRPAGIPPVCTDGNCFEVFSSNNNLGSLLPGPELPVIAGEGFNAVERAVCLSTALPILQPFTQVFACHGLVTGRYNGPAPAGFDYPKPTKSVWARNVMARAYKQALPGTPECEPRTPRAPLNLPPFIQACTAIPASPRLEFGPRGRGHLRLRVNGGSSDPKILADVFARDVRNRETGERFAGDLSYRVDMRITYAQCDDGTSDEALCTLPDRVFSIPVGCRRGTCKGKGDLDVPLPKNAVAVVEHTPSPLATGSPRLPCLYDGPEDDPSANEFGCVGIFIP